MTLFSCFFFSGSQFLTNTSVGKRFAKLGKLTWSFTQLRHWLVTSVPTYPCHSYM